MRHTTPPSTNDIIQMAEHALDAIPAELRAMVRGVAIMVEDVADDETLAAMGLENPWDLTGLYSGTPLTQKSVLDVALLDGIELANERDAIATARRAARMEGLALGISSGAALSVALRLAALPANAGKRIICIAPSFAERYLSTALFEGL